LRTWGGSGRAPNTGEGGPAIQGGSDAEVRVRWGVAVVVGRRVLGAAGCQSRAAQDAAAQGTCVGIPGAAGIAGAGSRSEEARWQRQDLHTRGNRQLDGAARLVAERPSARSVDRDQRTWRRARV